MVRKSPCLHIRLTLKGFFPRGSWSSCAPGLCSWPSLPPSLAPHFLPGVQLLTQTLFSPIWEDLSTPEMASVWGLRIGVGV